MALSAGTTGASPDRPATRRRGRALRRALAVPTAAALLAAAPAASATVLHYPSNHDVATDASGWFGHSSTNCLLGVLQLCVLSVEHESGEGGAVGVLATKFQRVSPLVGDAVGVGTWNSEDFTIEDEPVSATVRVERLASVDSLLGLGGTVDVRVRLIDVTEGSAHVVLNEELTSSDVVEDVTEVPVPVDVLTVGNDYRIELRTELAGDNGLFTDARVLYDDVSLAVAVGDDPADAPAGDPGDPAEPTDGRSSEPDGYCAVLDPEPEGSPDDEIELSLRQLMINQRIGQAAIRRVNAIERWLEAGVVRDDFCGGSIDRRVLHPTIVTGDGPGQRLTRADPRPLDIRDGDDKETKFTLTSEQLLINQRIYQAAVRRAEALDERLDGRLTGGDIRPGQITHGKLPKGRTVVMSAESPTPAASTTRVGERTDESGGSVVLSREQLAINQRIGQAAVRRANKLRRLIQKGLTGENFRPQTITESELAEGVRS